MNTSHSFAKHENMIFIDLDDTLICSTYITQTLFADTPPVPVATRDTNTKVLGNIGKVEDSAIELINEAVSMGVLIIVTNAQNGWIDYVMNTHFLRLKSVLNKNRIDIISARELHEKKFPNNPILWKVATFSQQIKLYENAYQQSPSLMISIGDGNHERIAFNAVAGNRINNSNTVNNNPNINTNAKTNASAKPNASACVYRSLKLMDTPQPHNMTLQLEYLKSILPSFLYIASKSKDAGVDVGNPRQKQKPGISGVISGAREFSTPTQGSPPPHVQAFNSNSNPNSKDPASTFNLNLTSKRLSLTKILHHSHSRSRSELHVLPPATTTTAATGAPTSTSISTPPITPVAATAIVTPDKEQDQNSVCPGVHNNNNNVNVIAALTIPTVRRTDRLPSLVPEKEHESESDFLDFNPIRLENDFADVENGHNYEEWETGSDGDVQSAAGLVLFTPTPTETNTDEDANTITVTTSSVPTSNSVATATTSDASSDTDMELLLYPSTDTDICSDTNISPTILSVRDQRTIHQTRDIVLQPMYCLCHIYTTDADLIVNRNTGAREDRDADTVKYSSQTTCMRCPAFTPAQASGSSVSNPNPNPYPKDPVTYILMPHEEAMTSKCN